MFTKQVAIPWGAWYGDKEEKLEFPEGWEVQIANPARELRPLSDDEICVRLAQPIGTRPIHELARGKKRVAVVIDDLTRPTPTDRLLFFLIRELRRAGIDMGRILILIGSGCHRFLTRVDLVKKLGGRLCGTLSAYNHHPYENLECLGKTARGTPVYISKLYLESDLRIGLGTVMPHSDAGFSGGAKIVAIGLAGIETISVIHDAQGLGKEAGPVGNVDNPMRQELEEIARMSGLDVLVNVVLNRYRQICGVFVGDFVEAHREAVKLAREAWLTEAPRLADIGVFNAYPKDTDAMQSLNALNPTWVSGDPVVRPEGAVVITTASPEGAGIHSQGGFGMRGHKDYNLWLGEATVFRNRKLILYSPNLTSVEVQHVFPPGCIVYNNWGRVIEALRESLPGNLRVAVFPVASFQLPSALVDMNMVANGVIADCSTLTHIQE